MVSNLVISSRAAHLSPCSLACSTQDVCDEALQRCTYNFTVTAKCPACITCEERLHSMFGLPPADRRCPASGLDWVCSQGGG